MWIRSSVIVVAVLGSVTPALAQDNRQSNRPQTSRPPTYTTQQSRAPVATQPSNNPFSNPIGQGVPPATSANPNLNSNRTNAPR